MGGGGSHKRPRGALKLTHHVHTTSHTQNNRHRNEIVQLESGVHSISTTPKFGIGQRCFLIKAPGEGGGNVLWDCISFLDADTVAAVEALGCVMRDA